MVEKGAIVRAHDPQAMAEAKKQYPDFTYVENAYEANEDADIVVLFTEWNLCRALDLAELKSKMKRNIFVDLRNVYSPQQVCDAGFEYYGLGRIG